MHLQMPVMWARRLAQMVPPPVPPPLRAPPLQEEQPPPLPQQGPVVLALMSSPLTLNGTLAACTTHVEGAVWRR